MLMRIRKPIPQLSELIDVFWWWKGGPRPHAKERLLPDGAAALVVNLREDRSEFYDPVSLSPSLRLPGAIISGPRCEHFVIDTEEQRHVAGVQFKPGGLATFIGMPASAVMNRHVALEDVWPRSAALRLRERLLATADDPAGSLNVMEGALLERARSKPALNPAVPFALREFSSVPHTRTVADVTAQIGLSPKRFIDVFRNEVGLTPKVFCRVRRFQAVLRCIQQGKHVDWAGTALACGYFDQAHFIHDFRAFSGLNPSVYLEQRTEHLNHVPLRD